MVSENSKRLLEHLTCHLENAFLVWEDIFVNPFLELHNPSFIYCV